MNELQDVGFYPPRVVNHASASPAAIEPSSQDQDRSEADKPTIMTSPSSEEEAILQEWCMQDHVGLPYLSLASTNGEVKPLSAEDLDELKAHINSGHLTKSHLSKGCLISEGPRRTHRSVKDVDKATHTLHIDIAGPLTLSDDGYSYFLVGALRLPGYPLLIDARFLQTRTSAEVSHELDRMISYFESLSSEGFPLADSPRICRLHSDRAGEFTASFFEKFLAGRRGIYHTLTTGYDPQANGTGRTHQGYLSKVPILCIH